MGYFYYIGQNVFGGSIKKKFKNAMRAFNDLLAKTCEIAISERTSHRNHKNKKIYYLIKEVIT